MSQPEDDAIAYEYHARHFHLDFLAIIINIAAGFGMAVGGYGPANAVIVDGPR